MKRYSSTKMRQYYEEWLASGQSKSSFCMGKGIVKTTFYYWVKKFQGTDTSTKEEKQGFKPLVLGQDIPTNNQDPVLRINYSSGVSIDFFDTMDADYIKRLCQ